MSPFLARIGLPRRRLKYGVLGLAKALGFFSLSKLVFRKRLLILCYHGFENHDEASFRPGLFMRRSTFVKRMQRLEQARMSALPLGEAIQRMRAGRLPAHPVVITIDDGFRSVATQAAPVLAERELPATLYATTYYMEKRTPIFRLVVQYMFWKTRCRTLRLEAGGWHGVAGEFDLTDPQAAKQLCWRIIARGESLDGEENRQALAAQMGAALGIEYRAIADSDMFRLMSPHELHRLHSNGMDIQLHTHRHTLVRRDQSCAQSCVTEEIEDNVARLEQWLGKRCVHFCYPSGAWDGSYLSELRALGVESATTCDTGWNDACSDPLVLRRFLDSEELSDLEFEAEICGFLELLRVVMRRGRGESPVETHPPVSASG